MSYLAFKVLHILGLLLVFMAVGGLTLQALIGDRGSERSRKLVGISHGAGLLLLLISGFAMLGQLGIGFPFWIWIKLAIWLLLGAVTVLIRRLAGQAAALWFLLPILGAIAGYLALFKPGS